jgi:hypothetical protein
LIDLVRLLYKISEWQNRGANKGVTYAVTYLFD